MTRDWRTSAEDRQYDVMISLHTHSLFSDGELCVSELVRRSEVRGYRAVAITDHADGASLEFIISRVVPCAEELSAALNIKVLAGVELTHVPPQLVPGMIRQARELGAMIVAVHGETITEPVAPGTNRAAIDGGADFLAHPGLISPEDAVCAAERGVLLEITTRKGHAYTNGHVVLTARAAGAKLVINTDAHAPGDIVGREEAERIARGAGLSREEIEGCFKNAETLIHDLTRDSLKIEN